MRGAAEILSRHRNSKDASRVAKSESQMHDAGNQRRALGGSPVLASRCHADAPLAQDRVFA